MKRIIATMMLGAFLATAATTVMAQDKPKKENKQDSTRCNKHGHKNNKDIEEKSSCRKKN